MGSISLKVMFTFKDLERICNTIYLQLKFKVIMRWRLQYSYNYYKKKVINMTSFVYKVTYNYFKKQSS